MWNEWRIRLKSVGCRWESQKEREDYENQDVGGWIKLGRIL
jgi:hypothetical protein